MIRLLFLLSHGSDPCIFHLAERFSNAAEARLEGGAGARK